ncbi:transcription antitermination factor NusB [Candidatus Gottesmanbacteria bacterium]|nr:transcription antitermination factor NusB [Candidatus Gottesmanbacteria bacterium]
MKSLLDPRHQKRTKLMKKVFAWDFNSKKRANGEDFKALLKNVKKIDAILTAAAPQWPLAKIAKVDLAILRLAVFELKIQNQTPPKVVIDEAVELSHEYGAESSSGFVNGVLGTIYGKSTKI